MFTRSAEGGPSCTEGPTVWAAPLVDSAEAGHWAALAGCWSLLQHQNSSSLPFLQQSVSLLFGRPKNTVEWIEFFTSVFLVGI